MSMTIAGADQSARRRTKLRRRFLLVSTALLATLLAILGVGFAADAGTSTVSVSPSAGVLTYAVAGNGSAPSGTVTLPKTSASGSTTDWSTTVTPSWSVAAGTAGTVDVPGDLVYIDATDGTSTKVMISVFVTNLNKLAVNYSSWAFDIAVYQTQDPNPANAGGGVWVKATDSFVTSDRGAQTFTIDLTAGKHLAITMDEGTFYTVQADTTTGALTPTFFIRATEL